MFSAATKSASKAVAALDPYFYYVTLLLTGDGTNGAQNNTFLDSSSNAFTITRNGNTTQGTFSPYGTLWSTYFSGSGDYFTAPTGSAFQFSGDFSVEGWYNAVSFGAEQCLFDTCPIGGATARNNAFAFVLTTGGALRYYSAGAYSSSTSNTVSINTWFHFAMVRSSNVIKIYINGILGLTVSNSTNFSTGGCVVGRYGDVSSGYLAGYMSNLRVVNGSAVYTSNFTPSTVPLTAITNTSFLTCQSNRFIDNSSNALTITLGLTPSIQRFSPFNPTSAYSTSVIGGSGYFDGSGDYLTAGVASNWTFLHNGSDWTIQFWVYHTATGIIGVVGTTAYTAETGMSVFLNNTGNGGAVNNVQVYITRGDGSSYAAFNSSAVLVPNAWNYVAITFTSSTKTCAFYINGASAGSSSNTGFSYSASAPTNTLAIGRYQGSSPGGYLIGYVTDVRLANSVLSSVSSAPTTPLTAVTNTQLLTSMTNAGIPDSAMMNDLETVGNAQVSTSVKKYGTGSLAFDGTGDWLTVLDNPMQRFQTGAFTVECWVYLTSSVSSQTIWQKGSTGNGGELFTRSAGNAGKLAWYVGATEIITASTALTLNTWYHVAYVRTSTATNGATIYINGVGSGTATDSTNYTNNGNVTIGSEAGGTSSMTGYIDDLRITLGYARYSANFTPPTSAFPTY